VAEAQIVIAMWRREYNEHRPHSSLGYQTPLQFRRPYDDQQVQAELLEPIKLRTNSAILTT
jgi:putative transposase